MIGMAGPWAAKRTQLQETSRGSHWAFGEGQGAFRIGADSGGGAGAGAHPWDGPTPLKIHWHSIAFKHQSITGRPFSGRCSVFAPVG